jgi:hypothetical protein
MLVLLLPLVVVVVVVVLLLLLLLHGAGTTAAVRVPCLVEAAGRFHPVRLTQCCETELHTLPVL